MLSFKFQFLWCHINFLKVNRWRLKHHKRLQSWRERLRMWENSAAAFPIRGRRLVPHVELFDSSFTLNYAFKLLFECRFSSSWGEGKFLRVYYLSSVIAGKNLRIVWKENSQVALILFRTFRSTALPPQTLFFLKTRTWHETSAAICQTSLCCFGVFLFCFLCFPPIYQPEGCTDQHFTQALHFHWTKQTLRTARVNFSGEMRRTTLIFFFFFFFNAWSFLKMMCLIYLNIKKYCHNSIISLESCDHHPEGKKHVLFFLGAVLWIVRAVILSLFCRAYVG